MDDKNDNDDINTKPPSFVMPMPTTATATAAVKSENYNHKTNNNNTTHTGTTKENRKKTKKRKVSHTNTAVAHVASSLFTGPDREVSSSPLPLSLLHSSNTSSNTTNNNHDSINNTNTANIGVTILAELKKLEQRQTTMHQEMKKEFKKMQDVMTAKISSLEQRVEALRQQQPSNQQHQQREQDQEAINSIDDSGSTDKNRNNNESKDGYDDEKKDDNCDGDGDGHDNNNDVHADVKDENEIQNNDEIIVISSSSSNSREDDDDDDRIENNGDEYNVDDDTDADTTAAAALLNSSIFDDEDTNTKIFKAWKRRYDVLQKYVESNSGCIPNCRYKNEMDEFALGYWAQRQKDAYWNIKKGKTKGWRMTKPRIQYLEQISNWTWGNKLPLLLAEREFADDEDTRNNNRGSLMEEDTNSQYFKKWNQQYEVLQRYVKSNNGRIPIGEYTNGIDGFQLGYWVKNQKAGYWNKIKGRAQSRGNSMTKPRAEWLESIPNWTWGACCVDGTRAQLKNNNNDSGMIDDDDEDESADDVIIF